MIEKLPENVFKTKDVIGKINEIIDSMSKQDAREKLERDLKSRGLQDTDMADRVREDFNKQYDIQTKIERAKG